MAEWVYPSVSDAIDAICDNRAPWLADLPEDEYRQLLADYQAEQAMVAEAVAALELHANGRGHHTRVSTRDERPNPTGRPRRAQHEDGTDGP
jgi:hypothetical protein